MACASNFRAASYQTLDIAATGYEEGYPAFLELHKKGLISDADKEKGYDLAVKYWAAYHSAERALEAYDSFNSAENREKVNVAINEAIKCLNTLTKYIQPFLKGD